MCFSQFSFLMAEAIMCHYNHNVLTSSYRRNTKTLIHWVLQVLGGGIGIASVLIQCIHDKFDLFNTHAKLGAFLIYFFNFVCSFQFAYDFYYLSGFAAFILCCISLISGLLSLFSTNLRSLLSPLLNKTFHTVLGIATFAVALCAQFYGYETGLFKHHVPSQDFVILMKCLTLISLVLSCLGPLKALFYKFSNMFYQ